MHATDTLAEADRLMTICNSCRYCEGLCAVFPAMEMRRSFADGDLNYLANLCHGCGACHIDCQFAPPHEFNVNVPQTLAIVRHQSYAAYAWPGPARKLFEHNALAVTVALALAMAGFIAGFVAWHSPAVLFASDARFYRLMPHNAMALMFGAAFVYAIVAMAMGLRAFWRDSGEPAATLRQPKSIWQAMKDAGSLRYLDGAGAGCFEGQDRPNDRRRFYHHLTFYGFMLCFAATSVATLYHYLLGREAPYPWWDLPVVLGTLGGLGLVAGPLGLAYVKYHRDPNLVDTSQTGMEVAFLAMLFMAGFTGLALLLLRATPAMGLLLALHLGVVFALFLALPYSKFVHGLYRFAALVKYARERQSVVAAVN